MVFVSANTGDARKKIVAQVIMNFPTFVFKDIIFLLEIVIPIGNRPTRLTKNTDRYNDATVSTTSFVENGYRLFHKKIKY